MAMADPLRQSNSLPSLSYLDIEKIKKETSSYAHKIPISAALNMSAPLTSPSIYSGPPPPYSYPSSTASSVVGINNGTTGYISPPESRHTSDHEKEPAQPPRLQSLPSIQEALGNEPHNITINSLLSKSAAVTQAPHSATHRSPTSPNSRSHPDTPTRPPPSFPHPPPPASYRSQESIDQSRPRYSPQLPKDIVSSHFQAPNTPHYPPSQPTRTASSPVELPKSMAHAMPQLRQTSPSYDYSRSTAPTTHQYSYSPYQATYSYPMQPPSIPAAYQPSQIQPPPTTWRSVGSDLDRAEEARKAASKTSPSQSFGETVKRHLDRFDLETSLNEIAEGSGRALSFSRDYGEKAHNTQRAGLSSESMPTLTECDEMLKRQRGVLDSIQRIRDVILKQQQDLAEQQRSRSQVFKAANDYDEDSLYGDKLDGVGGFAGADAKKRKGRAAPPGRCHSCNRAETPEWRRGPDGARTLCNACGLHYAKLTRKMGSKASSTGSNLRPKEASPGLPQ